MERTLTSFKLLVSSFQPFLISSITELNEFLMEVEEHTIKLAYKNCPEYS